MQRKGFVLVAALLSVLVIAGLVAGLSFAANEGTRMGVASAQRALTLAAAESSIEEALAASSVDDWSGAVGVTTASSQDVSGIPASVYRTPLDSTLFWFVADAGPARAGSGVIARIGALVRVRSVAGNAASVERIPERWWSELF